MRQFTGGLSGGLARSYQTSSLFALSKVRYIAARSNYVLCTQLQACFLALLQCIFVQVDEAHCCPCPRKAFCNGSSYGSTGSLNYISSVSEHVRGLSLTDRAQHTSNQNGLAIQFVLELVWMDKVIYFIVQTWLTPNRLSAHVVVSCVYYRVEKPTNVQKSA